MLQLDRSDNRVRLWLWCNDTGGDDDDNDDDDDDDGDDTKGKYEQDVR